MSIRSRTLIDLGVIVAAGVPLLAVVLFVLPAIDWIRQLEPDLFERTSSVGIVSCPLTIIVAPILGLAIAARRGYRPLWSTLIPSVLMFAAVAVLASTETDYEMWDTLGFPMGVIILSPIVWIPVLLHWFIAGRPSLRSGEQ